jgi:hypothetical protein
MIMLHRTDQPSAVAAAQRGALLGTVFAGAEAGAQRARMEGHYWEHGWVVEEGVSRLQVQPLTQNY